MRTLTILLLLLCSCSKEPKELCSTYHFRQYYKDTLNREYDGKVCIKDKSVTIWSGTEKDWEGTITSDSTARLHRNNLSVDARFTGEEIVILYWDFKIEGRRK